ncbi:hypothetical protein Btru_038798 [Bulinus truncatus]|nr:hypothetical protein Btru_038798 [Bulinus truncatus]
MERGNHFVQKTYIDTGRPCSSEKMYGLPDVHAGPSSTEAPRTSEELLLHAKDFIEQYYTSIKKCVCTSRESRRTKEQHSGTLQEVDGGAGVGGQDRNLRPDDSGANICSINWDGGTHRGASGEFSGPNYRHILTARGMYEALCNHIKYATNKGNLRSAITIFPQRKEGRRDFRVWNAQLIRYAGYKMDDGKIIGDPANVEFTEQCVKLGWKPKYKAVQTFWPLVLSSVGSDPEWFEIPTELIIEVNFRHPKVALLKYELLVPEIFFTGFSSAPHGSTSTNKNAQRYKYSSNTGVVLVSRYLIKQAPSTPSLIFLYLNDSKIKYDLDVVKLKLATLLKVSVCRPRPEVVRAAAPSGLLFDCGGLGSVNCPFNGWYMGTEISCRDLCILLDTTYWRSVVIRLFFYSTRCADCDWAQVYRTVTSLGFEDPRHGVWGPKAKCMFRPFLAAFHLKLSLTAPHNFKLQSI